MADSRRASSSSPSAASLKFGFANKNVEHAESSSRAHALHANSGNMSQQTRAGSRSPAPMDTNTHANDEGIRVSKTRRTGGFLLPSSLRHTDSTRRQKSDSKVKSKGKAKEDTQQQSTSLRSSSPYDSPRHNGAMRSSPLGHVVISPRPSYGDSQIPRPFTPFGNKSQSDTSSPRDGLSSEYTRVESDYNHDGPYQQQPAGIDPAQIVNMALNLSESRRRNMTAGQIVSPPTTAGRRISSGIPLPSAMVQGSYTANGVGSLRQHIQQQRHISRTHSPNSGRKTPNQRLSSTSHPSPPTPDDTSVQQNTFDYQYHVSSATLARAEKARQYIELSLEYRRLLQYLPPLKPNTTAGNTTIATSSVPGTTNVHLHRTTTSNPEEKHDLGRGYNPLQLIRNRKLRARTRNPLNPDVEHWQDTAAVKGWIDQVENASQRHGYRQLDKVILPPYEPLDGFVLPGSTKDSKDIGHRRNDGSVNKIKRTRQDWSFSPAEHLADAYWLEQDGNKVAIENRIGNPIYPRSTSTESLHPRTSYESRRSNKSIPASVASYEKEESDRESHKGSERRTKRPFLGHGHDESRGRLKHVWDKARGRSRSSSLGVSSSDDDASTREKRPKVVVPSGDAENVGPLERQMNKILGADQDDSPTFSPGTPNKWGTDFATAPIPRHEVHPATQPQEEVLVPVSTEVQDFVELAVPSNGAAKHNKRPSRILEDPNEPRSSFEDDNYSTNPNSPTILPATGADLTPRSRSASPTKKPKRSILPFIRTEGRRDHRKLDSGGSYLDDSDAKSSRHTSSEVPSAKPRGSLDIISSPIRVKGLISHKTNESMNDSVSRPSSRGKDNKEGKEPESAVRRFLKGGRLGEMVRHEGAKVGGYIRKRDSPQDVVDEFVHTDTDSLEESDTEDTDASRTFKERPNLLKRTTSAVAGKKDKKPQYHLDNLPSFKPNNSKASTGPSTPTGEDHISQQQLALMRNRSPRFDHLKPPGLDLSSVTSSPAESRGEVFHTALPSQGDERRYSYGFPDFQHTKTRHAERLKAILDSPGGVGRGGLPMTSLAKIRGDSSNTRPSLSDRRHWSISDQPRSRSPFPSPAATRASVSRSDIARVKALLLSSGIKAAEIHRRAYQSRNPPPKFLRLAAESSNASLRSVPRKEEHVLAARMLTNTLENESVALQEDMERFRTTTVDTLRKDLVELKDLVESCVERARNEGDESVRFGAEITGQRTIEVRRVVDALEKLARARRRRLRWIRRVGFGLVEWGVVMVMWWIWFLVIIWKAIWGTIKGIGRTVRWVFWL
ncbi:hypothetical protein EG327_000156 [Venturia inaequalis]|uniref:Uncharacterized protein n=1 Tax=Venturia inaequalis TaxID=5025 RepID=A0A8H3Z9M6_VENIN|nr:hypothetical protein EG327_000156 [Venturia inaequalis]